ncbi:hypothetical protein TNCV_582941 [Trichonephila clavipes]|nr:hypothetical protein TNCV_582941 [Trichonephila clavipes]
MRDLKSCPDAWTDERKTPRKVFRKQYQGGNKVKRRFSLTCVGSVCQQAKVICVMLHLTCDVINVGLAFSLGNLERCKNEFSVTTMNREVVSVSESEEEKFVFIFPRGSLFNR